MVWSPVGLFWLLVCPFLLTKPCGMQILPLRSTESCQEDTAFHNSGYLSCFKTNLSCLEPLTGRWMFIRAQSISLLPGIFFLVWGSLPEQFQVCFHRHLQDRHTNSSGHSTSDPPSLPGAAAEAGKHSAWEKPSHPQPPQLWLFLPNAVSTFHWRSKIEVNMKSGAPSQHFREVC